MTRLQVLVGYLATGLLLAVAVGIFVRALYRRWWSFALFVAELSLFSLGVIVWPDKFYKRNLWTVQEIVLNVLRLAAACEVGLRVFRPFPGALRTLRVIVLLVLAVTLTTIIAAMPEILDYHTFLGQIQPRVLNGAVWLFTAVAGLILWYRLPVNYFHKSIVLSYVPYLLVFTISLDRLVSAGAVGDQWRRQWVVYANQLAYLALVAYWTTVTWRRDRSHEEGAEEDTLTRLASPGKSGI